MLYFIHERTSSHEAHATQLLLSIPIALENCSENLMRALFNPMNRKTFSFPPQTRRKKSFTFLHREGCCCCSFYFVTEKKSINSYHSFSPIHTSLNNKQYFLTINHFEGDEICVILLCKVYERYQWREKKNIFHALHSFASLWPMSIEAKQAKWTFTKDPYPKRFHLLWMNSWLTFFFCNRQFR